MGRTRVVMFSLMYLRTKYTLWTLLRLPESGSVSRVSTHYRDKRGEQTFAFSTAGDCDWSLRHVLTRWLAWLPFGPPLPFRVPKLRISSSRTGTTKLSGSRPLSGTHNYYKSRQLVQKGNCLNDTAVERGEGEAIRSGSQEGRGIGEGGTATRAKYLWRFRSVVTIVRSVGGGSCFFLNGQLVD